MVLPIRYRGRTDLVQARFRTFEAKPLNTMMKWVYTTSRFVASFLLLLHLTMPIVAQTNEGTPETVVQNSWAAMQAADWAKYVSLIHPQSLARIRKSSDRFVNTLITFGEGNLHSYFGVTSRAEYAALSDAVVLERLLTRMAQQPGYQEILRATTYKLLGTVKESDDLVHVSYRSDVLLVDGEGRPVTVAKFEQHNQVVGVRVEIKLPEQDEDRASVISVKKDGDAWRILAVDEVENALSEWNKSIEEFQGHMKKFAQAMDQQKMKSPRKSQPQRRSRKQ